MRHSDEGHGAIPDGIVITRLVARPPATHPSEVKSEGLGSDACPDDAGPAPLAGVTLAIKDNIDVAGTVTTEGSRFTQAEARPAVRDAAVVSALLRAGAIGVAKVNLHEFAYGTTSANPWFGRVPNPVRPDRIPGGSSGGSAAALAVGIADLALGSDTSGSIRMPSACVGVVGLRPRAGVLDMQGVQPLCPSFDTVGPMAKSVELVAAAWAAMERGAGAAASAVTTLGVIAGAGGLPRLARRVAVLDGDGRLPAGFARVLARVGAIAVPSDEFGEDDIEAALEQLWPAFRYEAARTHAERFAARASEYDPSVAAKLASAATATVEQHHAGLVALAARRRRLLADWDAAGIDALVTPTIGCPVPAVTDSEFSFQDALGRYAAVWSGLNLPALAIGGVQVVGRTEADVLAFGLKLEAAGLTPEPAP